jgi:hypothetical protein
MSPSHERRAAALEAVARALLELAAVEREPEQRAQGVSIQPSPLAPEPAARARVPRTHERPLPAGMTAWVSPEDVARAVGCSRAKAHEYVRAAAGRSVGTGQLLRVPVDVWEAWARGNLFEGVRRERRGIGRASRCTNPPAKAAAADASATPTARRRRSLGPASHVESKLPLISLLQPRKR